MTETKRQDEHSGSPVGYQAFRVTLIGGPRDGEEITIEDELPPVLNLALFNPVFHPEHKGREARFERIGESHYKFSGEEA